MALIKLHNTLSGEKEEFKPIVAGEVSMYHCGPTVYNYAHIGNLRAYVMADILRRTMEFNGYKVKQVINITDVGHLTSDADDGDDKMTKALLRLNLPLTLKSMEEVGNKYTEEFKKDLAALNVQTDKTEFPKASDNIPEIIALIEKLQEKGFVYKTSDGLYFDISKFNHYGKLGKLEEEFKKKVDAQFERIAANKEKHNPRDFAVWKFNNDLGWEASFGKGFPGWHIECSAMSMKYLGETFDIHTGGIDHIPVHHNNEIAQSEAASGHLLANYWMHGAFINVDGAKISKSLNNDIYIKDLVEKNINPLAYRYLLLGANYSTQMNFTLSSLEGASQALNRLLAILQYGDIDGEIKKEYQDKFINLINDNLDTPKGLALLWEITKDSSLTESDKKATIFNLDLVLGLNLAEQIKNHLVAVPPNNVKKLLEERDEARQKKEFEKADDLRKAINQAGYEIKDTDSGSKLSKL